MPQDRTQPFQWEVAPGGYQWVTSQPPSWVPGSAASSSGTGRWLTDGLPPGARWQRRLYDPMATPTLFRIFGDTPPTEDGVLTFASAYGMVLRGETIALDEETHAIGLGTPLSTWTEEILHLRNALRTWDGLQAGDKDLVTGSLRVWEQHSMLWADFPEPGAQVGPLALDDEDLNLYHETGDLSLIALHLVRQTVNFELSTGTRAQLVESTTAGRPALTTVPTSLLGAMWFQFAQAIAEDKRYRRCQECASWFEVPPDARRRNSMYCRDACKSKAYRARKATQQAE